MSLIPLVDEDQQDRNERESDHQLMVDEAISIAHQLGMRTRDVINSRTHNSSDDEDEDDDEMDIQVGIAGEREREGGRERERKDEDDDEMDIQVGIAEEREGGRDRERMKMYSISDGVSAILYSYIR